MNCADLEALLCEYVDGTLPPARKAEVESHLAGCGPCAQLVQDASAAVEFMGRAERVEPPPELITKILYSLPAARHAGARQPAGMRTFLARLVQPMLQPRFAMGFAMTILSFSMIGKFVAPRQLTREDLNPVKLWQALDFRVQRAWDRSVKFYESLRLVYEIQSRLSEWTEESPDQKARPAGSEEQPAAAPSAVPSRQSPGTPQAQPPAAEPSRQSPGTPAAKPPAAEPSRQSPETPQAQPPAAEPSRQSPGTPAAQPRK